MVLVGALGAFSTASALTVNLGAKASTSVKVPGNATSSLQTSVKGNATSSMAQSKTTGNATSSYARTNNYATTSTKGNGKVNAETHGSVVVAVVKNLLSVAERDGGIGAQVRLVAQSQNESASTTVKAMTEIEHRNFLKRLFFGSDYKNLGELRTEVVRAQNDISRLEDAYDRTQDASLKADLRAQIDALTQAQVKLDAFIKAHESSFSLFGWMKNHSE